MTGETLQDRYLILNEIGMGGMGRVYLADDLRLEQKVAVKQTLKSPNDSDADIERRIKAFKTEAYLLAGRVKHSAIPRVIDYFQGVDCWFIVMEYIDGKSLEEQRRDLAVPFPEIVVMEWADQLLKILGSLHSQAPPIIHRDIKPSNIKVKDGQVYLLDFGLAKQITGRKSTAASFLTPAFASPEQMSNGDITVRSDLYSVAATIYCLLTNVEPASAVERSIDISSGRPDPLRDIKELVPSLPSAVSQLIMRAVSIDPSSRPASAEAMRLDLRSASTRTKTIPSAPLPFLPQNEGPAFTAPRRSPAYAWIATAVVASLLTLGVIYFASRHKSPPVAAVVANPLPATSPSLQSARELTAQALEKLYENDYEATKSLTSEAMKLDGQQPLAYALYGDVVWDTAEDPEMPFRKDEIQRMKSAIFSMVKSPSTAEEFAARAWADLIDINPNEAVKDADQAIEKRPEFAWAIALKASALSSGSRKAIEEWQKVVRLKRSYAQAHYNLAGEFEAAKRMGDAIASATIAIDLTHSAKHYFLRGKLHYEKKEYKPALADFASALEKNSRYHQARYYVGVVEASQSHFQRCIDEVNQALDEKKDPEYFYLRSSCYFRLKKYPDSLSDMNDALKLAPDNSQFYSDKAQILSAMGNRKEAASARSEAASRKPKK